MVCGDRRREWQAITGKKNKTLKSVIPITVYLRWPKETAFPGLWSALHSGSLEVVHCNLSNERTFQARHCGLWLQPPAHAVLTTKKQAKLFIDSSLTSVAKMSPIPSSYCHHSRLSLYHLHSSLAFYSFSSHFSYFLALAVVGVVVVTQGMPTLLQIRAWDAQTQKKRHKAYADNISAKWLTHWDSYRSTAVLGMFRQCQCLHSMW